MCEARPLGRAGHQCLCDLHLYGTPTGCRWAVHTLPYFLYLLLPPTARWRVSPTPQDRAKPWPGLRTSKPGIPPTGQGSALGATLGGGWFRREPPQAGAVLSPRVEQENLRSKRKAAEGSLRPVLLQWDLGKAVLPSGPQFSSLCAGRTGLGDPPQGHFLSAPSPGLCDVSTNRVCRWSAG